MKWEINNKIKKRKDRNIITQKQEHEKIYSNHFDKDQMENVISEKRDPK